jgi:Tol biopolymer transport system component
MDTKVGKRMGLKGKVVFSSGRAVDFDIWSLDLETGKLSQLTRGVHLNDHPRWSPDGALIAFTRVEEDGISSLWLMEPDGKNQRKLTHNIACQFPSWHPDGTSIIFSGNGGDRRDLSVCSVSIDGSGLKTLFDAPGIESTPRLSPDGESVIFAAARQDGGRFSPIGVTDIMEYRFSDARIRAIHSHPAHDSGPVYSPDGERIAFTSHRNGKTPEEYQEVFEQYREIVRNGNNAQARKAMQLMKAFQDDGDVYVSNRDGTHLVQLTEDHRADRAVCWSPCGNFLMFTSTELNDPNTDRLFVLNANSGEPVQFTYDREPLEREIGARQALNQGIFALLTPDVVERLFVESSFWGAERNPDWTR